MIGSDRVLLLRAAPLNPPRNPAVAAGLKFMWLTKIGYMNSDTETNFGWWTDKPERASRMAPLGTRSASLETRAERSVWKEASFIVALMLALGLSLVRLL